MLTGALTNIFTSDLKNVNFTFEFFYNFYIVIFYTNFGTLIKSILKKHYAPIIIINSNTNNNIIFFKLKFLKFNKFFY